MQQVRRHLLEPDLLRAGVGLAGMLGASLLIAAALLWLPAPKVAGGLALLLLCPAILYCPQVGLLGFLTLMYVHPEQWFPEVDSLHLPLLIAILTLVGWLFQLLRRAESFRWTAHLGWMAAFSVAMLLSGRQGGEGARLLDTLLDALRLALLFLLVQQLMNTPARARLAIHWYLGLTVLVACLAIYGWYSGTSVLLDRGARRAVVLVGNFDDPNDLAAYLVVLVPVALVLALQGGALGRRLCGIGALAALLPALFLCGSRGGLLALAAAVGAFLFRRTGWKAQCLLGACAICAVLAVALPGASALGLKGDDSAMGRVGAWAAGLEMFRGSPLLGVGYRAFTQHHPIPAHNSFVNALAEGGLAGALAWVGLNYWALLTLFRIERAAANPNPGNQAENGCSIAPRGRGSGGRLRGAAQLAVPGGSDSARHPIPTAGGVLPDAQAGLPLAAYAAALRAGLIGALAAGMFLSHTYRPIPLIPVALAAAVGMAAPRIREVDWRHYLAVPAITLAGAGLIFLVVRTLL